MHIVKEHLVIWCKQTSWEGSWIFRHTRLPFDIHEKDRIETNENPGGHFWHTFNYCDPDRQLRINHPAAQGSPSLQAFAPVLCGDVGNLVIYRTENAHRESA